MLELYKRFYESLQPSIECLDEDCFYELLDISGATDETILIVKQIKEIEEND